jgi:hypothetical protein
MRTEEQTKKMKLIFAFRNFANAPKNAQSSEPIIPQPLKKSPTFYDARNFINSRDPISKSGTEHIHFKPILISSIPHMRLPSAIFPSDSQTEIHQQSSF